MARHPPLRHRVQQLSTVPVVLWRRLVGAVVFAIGWLTVWLPGAATATALAGAIALWVWAGSSSSLEQAVALARPWVPALQTLTLDGTDASLRNGGRIQRLDWRDGAGLSVSAQGIDFSLDLRPLLKAEPLTLALHLDTLVVDDQSPPNPEPPTPPNNLTLPLDLQVALDVDRLTLNGPQPVHIDHLRAEYRYGGEDGEASHLISDLHLEVAQGSYGGTIALQAEAPMALNADLHGQLTTVLPAMGDEPPRPWQSPVAVRVRGMLANEDPSQSALASVQVQATLGSGAHTAAPAGLASDRADRHNLNPDNGPRLSASATLQPWQRQPLHALRAHLQRLDLAAFWPQLPTTLLSGDIEAQPPEPTAPASNEAAPATQATPAGRWAVQLALTNAAAGPLDKNHLPLGRLRLQAQANAQRLDVQQLQLQVGQGSLQGQGHWVVGHTTAQAQLTLSALPLHELHTGLSPRLASGRVTLRPSTRSADPAAQTTHWALDVSTVPAPKVAAPPAGSPALLGIESLNADGEWNGQQLLIGQLALRAGGAQVRGQGHITPQPLALGGQWRVQAPGLEAQASGHLAADTGSGELKLRVAELSQLHPWLRALPWGLGTALPPWPLSGDVALQAQWRGGWAQPHGPTLQARLSSQRASLQPLPHDPAIRTRDLQLTVSGNLQAADVALVARVSQGAFSAHLNTQARAKATATGGQLNLQPTTVWVRQGDAPHALAMHSPQPLTLDWQPDQWQLSPGSLRVQAQPMQAADQPPALAAAPLALANLSWQQMAMAKGTLSTQGQVDRLALDWLDALPGLLAPSTQHWLADAGMRSDLVWSGPWRASWPLASTRTSASANASPKVNVAPSIQLSLRRLQGDLSLRSPDALPGQPQASDWVATGLQQADLQLRTEGDGIATQFTWGSQLAGQAQAKLHMAWAAGAGQGAGAGAGADAGAGATAASPSSWAIGPHSALRGSLSASTPDMAAWSPLLAPPGWRARGRLALNAQVSGTLSQPDWRGELKATELALRSAVEGLEFANGRLVAQLSGERIDITQLSLDGPGGAQKGGTLSGTGHAQWRTAPSGVPQQVAFQLQAIAKQLRVSSRPDRRLTLSGDVSASLAEQRLQLRGQLAVDQALFVMPDETAPALGDDVVVRQTRTATPEPASRIKTDLLVRIDLGQQLEVRGQGLQTRLGGQVSLISTPSAPTLRVLGEVTTRQGSYRAYGQQLRIEEGVVRFSGPYDDPSLNILAVRSAGAFRDSDDQVVGVRITGSARAPLVKLHAKPDMPDSEKLAWLVLGRPASGAGAEAAVLQQAALALLSRNGGSMDTTLASRLGLDEIAFRGSSTRADGTTQNAGVALGKRLSDRLYVVYETGVSAAMGTVSLLYDVSRRLTLRTRAGEENAIDLLFTISHD